MAGNGDAKRLSRMADAARSIQTALGLHQDTVMARALLAELGARSLPAGESGFSYGRLHAREESLAAEAGSGVPQEWQKFPRSPVAREPARRSHAAQLQAACQQAAPSAARKRSYRRSMSFPIALFPRFSSSARGLS